MSIYIGNSMIISKEKETTPFGLKEKREDAIRAQGRGDNAIRARGGYAIRAL